MENGDVVDEVVVTGFRAPQSYTGEDVVEITGHGNPLVLRRIVECARRSGARIAEPGEFTLRAVANGKMDLIQAEAVREFIAAQTEQQARTALRQMEGALSRRLRPIKEKLVDVIAQLEAGIDFVDDDVEMPESQNILRRLLPIVIPLEELIATFRYGRVLTEGLQLAILGKPNVGKSSVFNRLVAADRAIVTDVPGTTRDVVEETVDFDGVPLRIADTAGIRETVDPVEAMGVERTLGTLSEADLTLVIIDGSTGMDDADERVLRRVETVPHRIVINKCDLPPAYSRTPAAQSVVRVSAKTGAGISELQESIREFVYGHKADLADESILTSARQNESVANAAQALRKAESALESGVPHEMVLLDLYEALSALDELTGDVVNDDILDRIFSTFCVGK
jgi:tRNA modification GTPase